jgi:hypothetical protein
MPNSDEYRARADECLARAERATKPDVKDRWLKLAADWIGLLLLAELNTSDGFDSFVPHRSGLPEKSEATT